MHKIKISIIHPSRNRVSRAVKAYELVMANAKSGADIQYILSIDTDDESRHEYLKAFKNKCNVTVNHNKSAIEAINNGASGTDGDILMVMSDDFDEMPLGWDNMILEATAGREFWVLKTFDKTQKWIITMPIMDRKFYKTFGYIYNPVYIHMFCDTELATICDMLDCVIVRNDIVFPHNHYTTGHEKDAVNVRNDLSWKQGEEMYFKRLKENFGFQHPDALSSIRDNGHVQWVKNLLHKYKE